MWNSSNKYLRLEIISNLRVNKGEDVLLNLDECLVKSPEQKYIDIIRKDLEILGFKGKLFEMDKFINSVVMLDI